MSADEINRINVRLQDLQDRQEQNHRALAEYEQIENHFLEINNQGEHLFARLYDVWHGDEELANAIEYDRLELQQCKRQILHELDSKKNEILKERQELFYLEDDLYELKRSIERGEDT
ncbi:DUF3958 family protein [Pseudogracilibacillus sp. SO30301A]|uniref:DUF3958 family protein n=1 Tax=Pseudogracilibacillus sp. SO30301A TaxID=3098291 RepID=UPI00300E5DDB